MKNIRLFVKVVIVILMLIEYQLGLAQTAEYIPAPTGAKVSLEIDKVFLSSTDAEALKGQKVSLGVYLVFNSAWKSLIEDNPNVLVKPSDVSWAFYEDNSCTPGNYLQNPADYISLCALSGISGQPADACILPTIYPKDWYGRNNMDWQQFAWPYYAWGTGFAGGIIDITESYYSSQDDGAYKIKIYDIQFILNSAERDLPVAFVDDFDASGLDGSHGNCHMNLANISSKLYIPSGTSVQDWTDLKGTSYFEFIPGGIFIERAPEVEKFEPRKTNSFC